MNHLIEQLVKDFRHHQHALESFGSLAVEVYIAYLLEKVIDHFHESLAKFLGLVREKIKKERQIMTDSVIPRVLATIKNVLAAWLQSGKKFFE